MKKAFIAMMACLAAGTAMAATQWHTNPAESNLRISAEDESGASLVQVKETVDGKFWITWLSWQDGMNGYIKAQLLDKDGNALLDEGGIYVMKRPTASWTSNYGMNVTPDGCLVVCHSDCGDDTERHAFIPRAYKVDQEGNQLWGLNGVEFPTVDAAGHRPKVGVTREGTVLIGFNDLDNASNAGSFAVFKMNEDGTFAWAAPLRTDGMFGAFAPCEDDDLFMTLIGGGAIQLYRIDSLGDYVWDAPLTVDDRDPNTRTEIQPVDDGMGGILIPYQRYINLSTFYSCIQRVTPDGEACMGMHGFDISEEPGQHSAPGLSPNGKRQEFVAAWNYSLQSENYLYAQKFDYTGTPIWEEPVVFGGEFWGYAATHATMLDDGSVIICYDDKHEAVKSDIKIMKLDPDGKPLWEKQISPEAYHDEPELLFDYERGEGYIFMTDNRLSHGPSPSGGIFAQNFKLVDDSESSVATVYGASDIAVEVSGGALNVSAPEAGTAYLYDATGALVASYQLGEGLNSFSLDAPKGLYIVRVACGASNASAKVCL